MSQDFIDHICLRWQELLHEYRERVASEDDITYRAVLGADGLFGGAVGGIKSDDKAKGLLVKILYNPWRYKQSRLFVALAVCDLAANMVESSVYDAFRTALGRDGTKFLSVNHHTYDYLQTALSKSNLFPIEQSRDGKSLYIRSLCRFVPAYKMHTEVLERLTLQLLRELADDWLRGRVVCDGPEFAERVSRSLARHYTQERVGNVLDPFCRLLRQVHQVFWVASEMEDFDDSTPEAFTNYFRRLRGEPPLAGQPLQLRSIWDDLRGLLGVQQAHVRTGLRGLQRRIRAGQITAMPDNTPVPHDLGESREERVPWGVYEETRHGWTRKLLVTAERYVNRFSLELYNELLRHPLGTGEVRLLRRQGQNWLLADWTFQVLGGPKSCPIWGVLDGTPIRRFVCRDIDRTEYALYGMDEEAEREPITLDGAGRKTTPRPRAVWRLVANEVGMQPCLVVRMPGNQGEESVSIRHQGKLLEEGLILWDAVDSSALSVPPQGELTLQYESGSAERINFRFDAPMLFVPGQSPDNWLPLRPADDLSCHERTVYLVGRADVSWQTRGFEMSPPSRLSAHWEDYALWRMERQPKARLLRISSQSRTYWEAETQPVLALSCSGACEARNDLLFYRDPKRVQLHVRGYLGRFELGQDLPYLHVLFNGQERKHTFAVNQAECHWSVSLAELLAPFSRSHSLLNRVSVTLHVPIGVLRRAPSGVSLCSIPELALRNVPVFRPDHVSATIEVDVPPRTSLEYRVRADAPWVRTITEDGVARLELPVTDELRAAGEARLTLRVEGIPFRDVLLVPVRATGLAVKVRGGEHFLGAARARATVDLNDSPVVEARELLPGESVCLTDAENGRMVLSLGHGHAPTRLTAADLRSSHSELQAWLVEAEQVVRLPLGLLEIEWTPMIEKLDAIVEANQVRILIKGSLPIDRGVLVVLTSPTGDVIDEEVITGDLGSPEYLLLFELLEDWRSHRVVVRGADGSELRWCAIRASVKTSSDAPTIVPPLSEDLDELLGTIAEGSGTHIPPEHIARLTAERFRAGDLFWWKSAGHAERLERLLAYLSGLPLTRLPLARAALLTAVAGCQADEDAELAPSLGPAALRMLLRWPVLGAAEETDDLLSVIKGQEIVESLLTYAPQARDNEWRRLGRFFQRTGRVLAAQLAKGLSNALCETATSPLAAPFVCLLASARLSEHLFCEAELFLAVTVMADPSSHKLDSWQRALPYVPSAGFEPWVRDLQYKPPRVDIELATRVCLTAIAQPEHQSSAVVRQALSVTPALRRRAIAQALVTEVPPHGRFSPAALLDLVDGGPEPLPMSTWFQILAEASVTPEQRIHVLRALLERTELNAVRPFLLRLSTEQRRLLARACLDGKFPAEDVFFLFRPANCAAELARWLELLADALTERSAIPPWTSSYLIALSHHPDLDTGDPETLIRCLPALVSQLTALGPAGRPLRTSLALLIGLRLPVDAHSLKLRAEHEPLADSIVQLMVDEPTRGNSGMRRCIDFYDPKLKNPRTPDCITELKRLLSPLTLLARALHTRREMNKEDANAFDLACNVHKLLGKWCFNLMQLGEADMFRLRAVQTYLAYLRLGRWESRTADVWKKIRQCLGDAETTDRRIGCLECASLRADQGFWRSGIWWLAKAAKRPVSDDPIPEEIDALRVALASDKAICSQHESDRAVIEMLETTYMQITTLRAEYLELEPVARQAIDRQRWFSILFPALTTQPDAEMRRRINAAVEVALRGGDAQEELAALLRLPGIPPRWRAAPSVTQPDFAGLLIDGTQGEPRQQIIAWITQGDPDLAIVLRSCIASDDLCSPDIDYETAGCVSGTPVLVAP